MALAVAPPVIMVAATTNLCWTAMVAPDRLPDWWLETSIALVVAAGLLFAASFFIGCIRRAGGASTGVLLGVLTASALAPEAVATIVMDVRAFSRDGHA